MEGYKKLIWWSTIVAIVLIIPTIIYFFFLKDTTSQPAGESPPKQESVVIRKVTKTASGTEKEPIQPEALQVSLDESDELLRKTLLDGSPHPQLKSWLNGRSNFIRRFVVVVDNIANGISPVPHLSFLQPKRAFKSIERGGLHFLPSSSYHRYDLLTKVFTSLNSRDLIKSYRQLTPAINEAYRELGYPEKKFEYTLFAAINLLMEAPVTSREIQLIEKVTSYTFNDPGLELLTDAQKHLVRMGPQNTRKIKAKLKEILLLFKD